MYPVSVTGELTLLKKILSAAAALVFAHSALAQSVTSGDINGTLTDTTGAAIPGAQIKVTNTGSGAAKTVISTATGGFRVSLLTPGSYKVVATAPGFATTSDTVTVSAGVVTADNLKLTIGQSSTTIEVTGEASTLNTQNGDVVTTISNEEVQALPNPGNDLTFVAQTAPGTVMNTGTASGGYGNFSSFGISGLSNMFTLDGGYENDPFLNLNNTGASNLTLGNNEVDTVTIVAPAFSAQYGGLGGAQVNEITRSGSNKFHGQLQYYWNGRIMNANDWFNKQNQTFNGLKNIPTFVNANQYAASLGGPVYRDKLFFFINTEGLRVTTPTTGQVYVPNAAFQNCSLTGTGCAALNAAALANCEPNGPNGQPSSTSTCVGDPTYGAGTFSQAPASQVPLLTRIYNTYNTSPFRPAASAISQDPNDVSASTYYAQSASFLSEYLITARVDYHISNKDLFFIHYKQDKGTQPTYVDLVSPLFSAFSPQPAWEGQMNETHTFTPNLVNQLVVTGNYYSAPFQNTNNYLGVAPFTFVFIDGDLQNNYYGGENYAFPQGRRVAGYQVIDDVSYNKGRNTLKLGYNIRRDNVTDLPQSRAVAPLVEGSVETFGAGQAGYVHSQNFPSRLEQPIAVYDQGFYIEDSFKATPAFTFTGGVRVERNSNPTCLTNCEATLAYTLDNVPTGAASGTAPYNSAFPGGLISANRHRAFKGYQAAAVDPRLSFAWQPFGGGKTVISGGFAMATDSFPASIADTLLNNAPTNFRATVYGSDLGYPTQLLDPSTAGSGGASAVASHTAFINNFNTGGNFNTTSAAVAAAGGSYTGTNFSTTRPFVKYPTYEIYSFGIEQQVGLRTTIKALYVGNHGYGEPVANGGKNLSSTGRNKFGANFFPTVPTVRPVLAFATLTSYYSGASSNFNGVVLSAQRQARGLTLQFNYQFSKALDEVSNGGLEPFAPDAGDAASIADPNNIHAQYGPADYNVKHNVTGAFVYDLPAYHRLKAITGGFQFSGDVFHQSGLPYTILQSTTSIGSGTGIGTGVSSFANGAVNLFAHQINKNFDAHCGGGAHALRPDGSSTPCNFATSGSFVAPTNFVQQGRNSLRGPSFTDVNFGAFKLIPIYHLESVKLKLGAQFFNLFNHPNFQNPGHTLSGTGTSGYGAISSTVSSPTNIFGSVGANSSPRLIQLKASLNF